MAKTARTRTSAVTATAAEALIYNGNNALNNHQIQHKL